MAWSDSARLDAAAVANAGPRWTIALDAGGAIGVEPPRLPALAPAAGSCAGSVVAARTSGHEWYAGWWSARADSSATLLVARSTDDGAHWTAPLSADARDTGRRGCARPALAIAADSATGFIHLAYFLEPAEGAGVWLTHSMEHGAMRHSPVAIAFGADPAATSVAAEGDTVVAAYESPNASEGWIGLALSTSDGHLIDWRIAEVSGRTVPARDPRVVLHGRELAVAWETRAGVLAMARRGTRR